jgi:hypothetical protein
MEKLLGEVPCLNGGFFEVHQLEEHNPDIDIPDKAFEKLFDFFDQYSWHLDERPLRADNEINPDVVGYIFEKYINQKQMGAYYTKEDITEYISKNTIIPFLFDAAQKKCAIAFQPDSALWRLLRSNPDRYIYPAVRHGVIRDDGSIVSESELPDFVQTGMRDPRARMDDKRFNLGQAPAGDPIRLVTETWREYMCRRRRCLEVREKLQKGEVHQINDLITLNLDIWQFARDVIVNAEGPELLRAFWHAIEKATVLDPTCGSGAFLFAALRILETLYSDCLERTERFVEDLADKPHHPEQYSDFKKVLDQLAKHPKEPGRQARFHRQSHQAHRGRRRDGREGLPPVPHPADHPRRQGHPQGQAGTPHPSGQARRRTRPLPGRRIRRQRREGEGLRCVEGEPRAVPLVRRVLRHHVGRRL